MAAARPLALITGASAGIGATFARTLAGRGYNLILVARRRERLEQLAAAMESEHSAQCEVIPADLTDAGQLGNIEACLRSARHVDLLINNAGFGISGRFWETDLAAQTRLHQLHIVATMRLTHAALSAMTRRGGGAVINVSSVAAFAASPSSATYAASKCWMNSFTEGLYLDLKRARSPVRIQALCPGFTLTEFHQAAGIDPATVPSSWWTTAESVVAASLDGLEQNKLFVVPGRRYQVLVQALGFLPARLIRAAAIRVALKRKR